MLKIREVVVVEGRYDKNALLQSVDCVVLETSGFGIFNDSEKAALIRRLAAERGIIVLTDSDSAGFMIRNHMKNIAGSGIKNAYIPDIYGKEKRKKSPSKEGKLGVEGMSPAVLAEALRKAGATFLDEEASPRQAGGITKADFFSFGLSGTPDSSSRRASVLKALGFPEKMSTNAMLEAVNLLYDKTSFQEFLDNLRI